MAKKTGIAVVVIFVVWSIIDFLLHGLLLRPVYESAAELWRPAAQVSTPLAYLVVSWLIVCFVLIYGLLIDRKSLKSALLFGALYGMTTGFGVGFGTYIHMPVPLALAWGWSLGGLVKGIAAGAVVGAVMRPERRG